MTATRILPTSLAAKHLRGTEGAREVPLAPFRLGLKFVPEVVAADEVGALLGPAGTGKTFTIKSACGSLGLPVVYVEPGVNPRVRATQCLLLDALKVTYELNAPSSALDRLLIDALGATRRVLVIDEAARLGRDGLEELRYLHCQVSFPLFLVGSDLESMLRRNPALDSRIARRVRFGPLKPAQEITFARRYHEVFENATDGLLHQIARAAKGNLRVWARTLESILTDIDRSGAELVLTRQLVLRAIAATQGLGA